ncbi:MAG TPA: DUF5946 family protein [Tepidisphaeraceae bacterium]|nr:DUF5946 family protein [Tepidisphaeraceae bacterium]
MTDAADTIRCVECGAIVPAGFESCKAVFEDVCALEYGDPRFGAVHLLTVDAYTLQHSAQRGPRSNAFHLMRVCRLIEHGDDPTIGRRPPRHQAKAFEKEYRDFPYLAPPSEPGALTIVDVHGAAGPEDHAQRVRRYAQTVWQAWEIHHPWAREWAGRIVS